MAVSFGSLASGLPTDIVDKLADAERQPIRALQVRKADIESKQKLVADLKSRITAVSTAEMMNARGFREMKSVSGDPNIISATVDKTQATPASYNIEVVQLAKRSSAMSTAFPDKDKSQAGVGYISFENAEGEEKSIFIGPNNNTLQGISTAINTAGLGFISNVIDDGKDKEKPYRLVISGQQSGSNAAVKWPQFYFLDGDYDFYIEQEHPAQDAKVKIDGFEVALPENKINGQIPGVAIDIHKAEPGKEISLSIKEDIETISDKVKKLVDSINKVIDFIQQQNSLTSDSNTKNTLGGDITLTTIESKIRTMFSSPIAGTNPDLRYLTQAGISFQRNGRLAFDEQKFSKLLTERFDSVARLFVGNNDSASGIIPTINRDLKAFIRPGDGILSNAEEGLRRRIKTMDKSIADKETLVAKKTEQLKNTFAKLESAMSAMKNQSNYVQSALGGAGGGGLGGINLGGAKVG